MVFEKWIQTGLQIPRPIHRSFYFGEGARPKLLGLVTHHNQNTFILQH